MRLLFSILLAIGCATILGCETLTPATGNLLLQETVAPDETIINSVHSGLAQSGNFNDVHIQVSSERGMVTLSGFVRTIKQYDTAVKIASETPHVNGVRNHLVIRK